MTTLEERPTSVGDRPDTFDERWNAWQAKGRDNTIRSRLHVRIGLAVLVLIVVAMAVWAARG